MYAVNHHLILFIHNFIFGLGLGLDLKKLAWVSALTSKPWSQSRPQGPGIDLGLVLEILASFNITGSSSSRPDASATLPPRYLPNYSTRGTED